MTEPCEALGNGTSHAGGTEERIATGGVESMLFSAAANWPAKTALIDGDKAFCYETLAGYVAGFAEGLTRAGVSAGGRVAMFLDKSIESVVTLFGIWTAGAIAVPVHEGLKSRQVSHILSHSGSKVLVSTARKLARIERSSYAAVDVIEPVLSASDQKPPWRRSSPNGCHPKPAIILYTSGSTGRPKGILTSHDNLLAGARIVVRYLELQHDERILSVLPFSFDYGLNQLLTAVRVGATLVLLRSHLPADISRAMAEMDITGCAGVPPFWIQLLSDVSPFRNMEFPKLRYITNSGGVFPVDLVRRYRRHLPAARVFLMYGLSEAFRSTYLPPELTDQRPDSIGKAIPESEILVVDESGNECGPGEVGELVHRGPTVALGYWNDPEATARVFRPDTLPGGNPADKIVFSGDLVRRDQDGFLYFAGRRDKMIKTLGWRVSPEEVEEHILACPLVREVAVCGKPDQERGASIVAHLVPANPEHFNLAALVRYCQAEMPSHMQPRDFVLHRSLPRTTSGKIDRQRLD